ncbi:hypothetical protein LCGC14_2251360, partial [marine sediment metagenome]
MDLETTGLDPWKRQVPDRLCGIAISDGTDHFYMPFRHANKKKNLPMEALRELGTLLSDPDRVFVGFNYKFDLKFLFVEGIGLPKTIRDPYLAAHLCNENEPLLGLKPLSDKYLGNKASKEQRALKLLLRERGLGIADMWRLEPEQVAPYACDDVRLTLELRDFYLPHLEKQGLLELWEEVSAYELIVAGMEIDGIRLNAETLRHNAMKSQKHHLAKMMEIRDVAGYTLNPNSSKQVCNWLEIDSSKKAILEILHNKGDERATLILQARCWRTADSRYYQPLLRLIDGDGLGHPSFKMCGTYTGRMSSGDPFNWQSFANPREKGYAAGIYDPIKDAIEADEDEVMVEADYSQAEIKVACHYGQETRMGDLVNSGEDIHGATKD